jgi:hypothetical protein
MRAVIIVATFLLFTGAAVAGKLTLPTGTPILTIEGAISNHNKDQSAILDIDMLDALPGREAAMETPWTNGITSFSGPLAREVLDFVGAEGTTLRVRALNDFEAEIPMSDFRNFDVILATRINGERISVREKGPIFVIYPFDKEPQLYTERYFNRSVWQVMSITVK